MHRALQNIDIVSAILSSTDEAKVALSFALTARCFLEEGLKATWAYGSVFNLAGTMPDYICTKEESGGIEFRAFVSSYC